MAKLFLKETSEFIKECSERDCIELIIHSPGEYYYTITNEHDTTIQDLNDFVNRSMERNKNAIQKQIPDNAKSKLTRWSEIWCVIAGAIALIGFIVWLIKSM